MKVIMERYPYRYVETGTLENGFPDYRIQKQDYYTKRYRDMYLCDNGMQLTTAIEDFELCSMSRITFLKILMRLGRKH